MVDVKQNYLTHINLRKKCLTVFIVLMRFHYYIGVMEIMGALIKEGLMLFCKAYCSKDCTFSLNCHISKARGIPVENKIHFVFYTIIHSHFSGLFS